MKFTTKKKIGASSNDDSQLEGYNPRIYRRIKIVYILLSILNIVVVMISFSIIGWSMYDAQRSYANINKIENDLLKTNKNIMMIVVDVNSMEQQIKDVTELFRDIDKEKEEFDKLENIDKEVADNVDLAFQSIQVFRERLSTANDQYAMAVQDEEMLAKFQENIMTTYEDKIAPIMKKATEQMDKAVEAQEESTLSTFFTVAKSVLIILALLILILVLGIIAIIMMQRAAKRQAEELKKRADDIAAAEKKLKHSRDKTKSLAYMNVLTGLKNRYALEDDIGNRLSTDNFTIANFDFDNFRSFNEVYGRDFGDAFLSAVAERLNKEFSNFADIYNLTSDEFTFVFKKDIGTSQAGNLIQRIQETITGYYNVDNLTVRLTVSGCVYNYLAGDYDNISSVLSLMDKTLHKAKNSGGNQILPANQI